MRQGSSAQQLSDWSGEASTQVCAMRWCKGRGKGEAVFRREHCAVRQCGGDGTGAVLDVNGETRLASTGREKASNAMQQE